MRAEKWFERCVQQDAERFAPLADRVHVGIGRGERGPFLALTLLPSTANGLAINDPSEATALADLVLYAAGALCRESIDGR